MAARKKKTEDVNVLESSDVMEENIEDVGVYNDSVSNNVNRRWLLYFEENTAAMDNPEAIETIGTAAVTTIKKNYQIDISDDTTMDSKGNIMSVSGAAMLMTAFFIRTTEAMLKFLVSKTKNTDSTEYKIKIADQFEIGYTNMVSEDDEKSGNYMIYMKHLGVPIAKEDGLIDIDTTPLELTTQWYRTHTRENPEAIGKMCQLALNMLGDKEKGIDIELTHREMILPLWITYYQAIITYIEEQYKIAYNNGEFEYSLNFSWFIITARESENVAPDIIIEPTISSKLELKSDQGASSSNE